MSATTLVPDSPQLSPAFDRARTLSRIFAIALTVAFWFTLILGAFLIGAVIVGAAAPDAKFDYRWGSVQISNLATLLNLGPDVGIRQVPVDSVPVQLSSLPLANRIGMMLAFLLQFGPAAAALMFGRRVFARLAKGEVFSQATIANMRFASLWMVVLAFTSGLDEFLYNISIGLGAHGLTFNPGLLFFGLCVYVVAHVMAEARRIADDNASFV